MELRTSGCSAFCVLHSEFCIRLSRFCVRPFFLRLILAASILFLSGCAYYNTFYNAQVLYNDGVKLVEANNKTGAKDKFEKAVKKSAVVIKNYPKSQWVDDALFLVAMSYYQEGEYIKAIVKFENFAAAFPNSEFRDQARLYHALSLIGDEQYVKGIQMLKDVRDNNRRWREEATYQLALTSLNRKEYSDAIDGLQAFMAEFPRSKRYQEAAQLRAEALFNLGRYDEAIKAYAEHRRLAQRSRDRTLDNLQIAECYVRTSKPDSVLAILQRVGDKFPEYNDRINLLAGKAFLAKGKKNEAIASLNKVRAGTEGSEACLLLGKSCEQDTDFAGATAYYDSAHQRDANSAFAREAGQRALLISRLNQLSKGTADTAEAHFLLAELYHLSLGQDTTALAQYQKVADSFPKSPYAAKALYAIAWIRQNGLKANDSLLAYQSVVTRYPKTVYAQEARKVLGQPLLPDYEIEKPQPPKRDTSQKVGGLPSDTLLANRLPGDSLGRGPADTSKAAPPVAERPGRRERSRDRRERGETPATPEPHPTPPDTLGRKGPVHKPEPKPGEISTPKPPAPESVPRKPGGKSVVAAKADTATKPTPPAEPKPAPPAPKPESAVRESTGTQPLAAKRVPSESASAPVRPPPTPERPRGEKVTSDTSLKPIYFGFDSSALSEPDTLLLKTNLDRLLKIPNVEVTVSGFCDPRGSEVYNDGLGRRRAEAIKQWLVKHGIDARRIQTYSYGKALVIHDDPETYWSERRAEFRIRTP